MKSSFKTALEPNSTPNISPFHYPESGELREFEHPDGALAGDLRTREAAARESGRQEGEIQARAAFEQQLEAIHAEVVGAIGEFAKERAAYFQQVETEVVHLSLSIARKVLHREAQVDPSLLAGMVRWALDKIESGTVVQLRIHPCNLTEFRRGITESGGTKHPVEIIEDPSTTPNQCVLHTELGSTEIGVEVQFKEIEQGLLDLLSKRPNKP